MATRPLPPTATAAAAANVTIWRLVADTMPGAWVEEAPGAAAVVTGVASPMENGVWVLEPDVDAGVVDALLDRVAATRLPHCLWLREGTNEGVARRAEQRRMRAAGEEALMIAREPPAARRVEGLRVRRLRPDEGPINARIAAVAFGTEHGGEEIITNPRYLALPEVRAYAGEAGGETVATAVGVTVAGCTAIFGVATLPSHRGRGYGAALATEAVRDGFAAGAGWAWLNASPRATRLYERLGFVTVETQPFWSTG